MITKGFLARTYYFFRWPLNQITVEQHAAVHPTKVVFYIAILTKVNIQYPACHNRKILSNMY